MCRRNYASFFYTELPTPTQFHPDSSSYYDRPHLLPDALANLRCVSFARRRASAVSSSIFSSTSNQTLYGTSGPHHPHDANQRCRTGLGHAAAKYMLEQNFHSAAPSALLPKADKQWKSNLADAGKHHTTHWFTGSYHAQLPSQWAEQVLAFNTTIALSKYFYNAVRRLRKNDTSATTSTLPDPVPGYTHYSSLSPRLRTSRLHTHSSRPHS